MLDCGGESGNDPELSATAATTVSTGAGSSAASTDLDTSSGPSPTSTGLDSSGAVADTSGAPSTTGGGPAACDPAMAPFLAQAPALPQASIHIDFETSSCAATSAAGEAPQIVLDVQRSGLINATLFGLEIVSVSSGQPFADPPMGDAAVIDLLPDLPITFETTGVASGTTMTISFEIFSTGPTLLDVRAEF